MASAQVVMAVKFEKAPPTREQVIAAGFSERAAESIVKEEALRFELKLSPYGSNEPTYGEGGKLIGSVVNPNMPQPDAPAMIAVALPPGVSVPLSNHDTYITVRGRRRMSSRERRMCQAHLGGVRLVCVTTIDDLDGSKLEPGTDITEKAALMTNLPLMLKRGWVKADPPVDWARIQMAKSTEPGVPPHFVLSQEEVDASAVLTKPDPFMPAEEVPQEPPLVPAPETALVPDAPQVPQVPQDAPAPTGLPQVEPDAETDAEKARDALLDDPAALWAELAALTEKDSAKHVLSVVRKVLDAPIGTTKKDALALRDAFLAAPATTLNPVTPDAPEGGEGSA